MIFEQFLLVAAGIRPDEPARWRGLWAIYSRVANETFLTKTSNSDISVQI